LNVVLYLKKKKAAFKNIHYVYRTCSTCCKIK